MNREKALAIVRNLVGRLSDMPQRESVAQCLLWAEELRDNFPALSSPCACGEPIAAGYVHETHLGFYVSGHSPSLAVSRSKGGNVFEPSESGAIPVVVFALPTEEEGTP